MKFRFIFRGQVLWPLDDVGHDLRSAVRRRGEPGERHAGSRHVGHLYLYITYIFTQICYSCTFYNIILNKKSISLGYRNVLVFASCLLCIETVECLRFGL